MLLGNLSSLSEQVSEGKSGSLFFWSQNSKFVIKTISKDERETMFEMLEGYYNHVRGNPATLLTRYLGLYKMMWTTEKGGKPTASSINVIVMANVFCTPLKMSERYDLKGSTVGRTTQEEGATKKDLDFVQTRKIYLGAEKFKLMAQIRRDTAFLAHHNIMDYSLLVGIVKVGDEKKAAKVVFKDEAVGTPPTQFADHIVAQSTPSRLRELEGRKNSTESGSRDTRKTRSPPVMRTPTHSDITNTPQRQDWDSSQSENKPGMLRVSDVASRGGHRRSRSVNVMHVRALHSLLEDSEQALAMDEEKLLSEGNAATDTLTDEGTRSIVENVERLSTHQDDNDLFLKRNNSSSSSSSSFSSSSAERNDTLCFQERVEKGESERQSEEASFLKKDSVKTSTSVAAEMKESECQLVQKTESTSSQEVEAAESIQSSEVSRDISGNVHIGGISIESSSSISSSAPSESATSLEKKEVSGLEGTEGTLAQSQNDVQPSLDQNQSDRMSLIEMALAEPNEILENKSVAVEEVVKVSKKSSRSKKSSKKKKTKRFRIGSISSQGSSKALEKGKEVSGSNIKLTTEEDDDSKGKSRAEDSIVRRKSSKKSDQRILDYSKGLTGRDGDEIYFIGIIDILITWDSYKKVRQLLS